MGSGNLRSQANPSELRAERGWKKERGRCKVLSQTSGVGNGLHVDRVCWANAHLSCEESEDPAPGGDVCEGETKKPQAHGCCSGFSFEHFKFLLDV